MALHVDKTKISFFCGWTVIRLYMESYYYKLANKPVPLHASASVINRHKRARTHTYETYNNQYGYYSLSIICSYSKRILMKISFCFYPSTIDSI